jgi:hypothetical protein
MLIYFSLIYCLQGKSVIGFVIIGETVQISGNFLGLYSKVPNSNMGRDTSYPAQAFSWFYKFSPEKFPDETWVKLRQGPSNFFPINHSPANLAPMLFLRTASSQCTRTATLDIYRVRQRKRMFFK